MGIVKLNVISKGALGHKKEKNTLRAKPKGRNSQESRHLVE
jgi:hypothetical protein